MFIHSSGFCIYTHKQHKQTPATAVKVDLLGARWYSNKYKPRHTFDDIKGVPWSPATMGKLGNHVGRKAERERHRAAD